MAQQYQQQPRNQQQYYQPQKPVYTQPKNKGGGFSLFRLLLHIVFSPVIIVLIGLAYYQDLRKAILLALIVITAFSLISLLFKMFKLGLATMTLNIFGFLKTVIDIIIAIVFIAIYWVAYILFYGQNFT